MKYPVGPEITKALELAKLQKRLKGDKSETIKDLYVSYSTSLAGLQNFPDLEVLILAGCDPVSPEIFPNLNHLVSLRIHDSGLCEIKGIKNFPALHLLSIQRNMVQDLKPLLESNISSLEVEGNPLSEQSYYEVLPELVERGCKVSCSQEREWRITLRMQAAGIPLVCYASDGRYHLCSPGLGVTKVPDYDHPEVEIDELEGTLNRNPSELLSIFESRGGTGSPPRD